MSTLFLHGLGQNELSWDPLLYYLSAGAGKVMCPDLSTFLEGEERTYTGLYHSLVEYCGHCPDKISLCGLSLGAILALNYAIDYPENVSTLVLIAGQDKMPGNLLKLQNWFFRLMPKHSFESTGFSKNDFITLTSSMADLDFSGKLGKVACPALVLCGARDKANKKAAVRLAQGIKGARLQFIKNAGHEVNTDAPEQLADCLNDFYEGLGS